MQLIAWLGLCLVASTALRRHGFALSVTALILWCGVPGVAGHYLTGTATPVSGVHPAAFLVLTTLGVQLFVGDEPLRRALGLARGWLAVLLIVVAAAFVTGLVGRGLSTVVPVVNQLVAPISLFCLLGGSFLGQPRLIWRFRVIVLTIAVAQSGLSILQVYADRPLLWTSSYQGQYWFNENYHRWMGTFDHPLILSVLLACSIFLLAEIRRWWVTLALLLLFIGGLLATQSRTGFVAAGVGAGYLIFRARLGTLGKLTFLTLAGIAGVAAFQLGAVTPLQDRVADDSGSSGARQEALDFFARSWTDYLWTGRGLDSSFQVASQVGLETSFESAAIMYSIDLGLILTLTYFAVMVAIIWSGLRRGAALGSVAAASLGLILIQTFSGISGVTAVAPLLWSLLGLVGFSAAARPVADPTTGIEPAVTTPLSVGQA